MHTFYEFFAGGGMARLGLGSAWDCLFANDFEQKKAESYLANFGQNTPFKIDDVANVRTSDLFGKADLAWASFPCQDLSLAGKGRGLRGKRSGVFWDFWRLIEDLNKEGRRPSFVILENVTGLLTSHKGNDFKLVCEALVKEGYRIGPLVMDARFFVPQSRPRLFIVGVSEEITPLETQVRPMPDKDLAPKKLIHLYDHMDQKCKQAWIWWNLPERPHRKNRLEDLIEENPMDVKWFSDEKVQNLLQMMDVGNLEKVVKAQLSGKEFVGAIYKRTRVNSLGKKEQRAEIRFDGLAGCLRTPAGGSSKQILIFIYKGKICARHVSGRESARLMGIADSYQLPLNNNQALHLTGDGLVVPVVKFISRNILEPMLQSRYSKCVAAE